MAPIPYVGKCFPTVEGFLEYLDHIKFGAWRPRYVTMHHTGSPDLKTWRSYGQRKTPISDAQWMGNLAAYYGNEMGWRAAPQFFFTPKNYCVLSLPDRRGVHAVSFNANSWGVECVGDFDREPFDGEVRDRYVDGLAALHVATGLQLQPFRRGEHGLHFHRDDPKTNKTCPGKNVLKDKLIPLVQARIDALSDAHEDHPSPVVTDEKPISRTGKVSGVGSDTLNVRASAGGKAVVIASLKEGAALQILGEAMNDGTRWLKIDLPGDTDGWVAARFVKEAA